MILSCSSSSLVILVVRCLFDSTKSSSTFSLCPRPILVVGEVLIPSAPLISLFILSNSSLFSNSYSLLTGTEVGVLPFGF